MENNSNAYIEKFLIYMKGTKRCLDETIKTYRKNLNYLFEYLKINDIAGITEDQIEAYLSTCEADRTFNQRLSTFKHFFKWAKKKGYIDHNPAIEIDGASINKGVPKFLKENEVDDLIKSIDGKFAERDTAIVMLLLNGLRRIEVSRANVKDIQKEKKTDVIKVVKGKGNKTRVVILYHETCQAIQEYLNCKYRSYYKDEEAIFLTQDGKRLSAEAIAKQTKKYLTKINKEDYSCHKLRHTFATELYKRTRNLLLVQNQLGHDSISNTEIYTHLDLDTIIESVLENK